jgi:hypothetical protein
MLELQARQACVEAAACNKLGVGAFLDDPALVHDQNAVGAKHSRQRWAMTIVVRFEHQPFERLLNQFLAFRIERRCRLVEQQDRASRRMARAMAMRWRWPPESVMPRSPTGVS